MTAALMSLYLNANSKAKDDIDDSMMLSLEKINPKFRSLTDLLFFSDRMDLDLSEFKALLKENYAIHSEYLWDRFSKSAQIFWEDGSKFWSHRLTFLLDLNDKNLSSRLEEHLEKRMFDTVRAKHQLDFHYDIEYLQFLEYCKIKHKRNDSLLSVRSYFTEMPATIHSDKLIKIVEAFIPIVFTNIDEYVAVITKKITTSARNFDFLLSLQAKGIAFDKAPIIELVKSILMERAHNDKNRRAFFTIIKDDIIRQALKDDYQPQYRAKLIALLEACNYQMIEENHLINIKNIIDLDPSVTDDLIVIYADSLYKRSTGHKKANADRLIRVLKTFPQIAPKKILAYLSNSNKMNDIKYVLSSFPDLKKLAVFV